MGDILAFLLLNMLEFSLLMMRKGDHRMEENTQDQSKTEPIVPVTGGAFKAFIRNIWRACGYYIFFAAVFVMLELLLRLSTDKKIDFTGFSFSVIFNLILITLFCYAMSFISKKKTYHLL
jgi:hypothetical protein